MVRLSPTVRLVLSSRREQELESLAKELNLAPDQCLVLPLDLEENQYGFQSKVDSILDRFKRIDVLFNNAGVSQRGLVKDTLYKVDARIMNINYMGTITLTKAVLPVSDENCIDFRENSRRFFLAFSPTSARTFRCHLFNYWLCWNTHAFGLCCF